MASQSSQGADAEQIVLPGFGALLFQQSRLRVALHWRPQPITLRERLMVQLMAELKDKPEWERKVFDDEIVDKWRREALDFRKSKLTHQDEKPDNDLQDTTYDLELDGDIRQLTVSDKMFDYMLCELRDDARTMQKSGFTPALNANAIVYMSDTAVNPEHQNALKQSVAALENIPPGEKDWHPGSDNKVLDLVHPSLFPLIYGRTKILPTGKVPLMECSEYIGRGETIPEQLSRVTSDPIMVYSPDYSNKFQWLPCDVMLHDDGNAKIVSYINGLHPQGHERLYSEIENVIAKSVPLWTDCLLSTLYNPTCRLEDPGDGFTDRFWSLGPERMDDDSTEEEFDSDHEDNFVYPEPGPYSKCRSRGKWLSQDSIREYDDSLDMKAKILQQISDCGLQVVVKLANIHLTPEKPSYSGGSWHVEGMLNEHICASALYYFDSHNVTDSYLGFRESVSQYTLQSAAPQSYHEGIKNVYSIAHSNAPPIQFLGRVQTREGRLLAFPNVLQHQVSNFELADPTKPGHRKLLALFLVDPFIRIPSSANVPPQRADWWTNDSEMGKVLSKFPPEVTEHILKDVGFPLNMDEAKLVRDELIEERKTGANAVIQHFKQRGYNFCEH